MFTQSRHAKLTEETDDGGDGGSLFPCARTMVIRLTEGEHTIMTRKRKMGTVFVKRRTLIEEGGLALENVEC